MRSSIQGLGTPEPDTHARRGTARAGTGPGSGRATAASELLARVVGSTIREPDRGLLRRLRAAARRHRNLRPADLAVRDALHIHGAGPDSSVSPAWPAAPAR